MVCRPAFLIAFYLTILCLFFPASGPISPPSSSQLQTAPAKRNLSAAIYRFWSGTEPFCEQYFQLASRKKRRIPPSVDSQIQFQVHSEDFQRKWLRINFSKHTAHLTNRHPCHFKDQKPEM